MIQLIDVGGQRSQRRKWLHCFDNVATVIFVVACSEYDQTLREDPTVNRMTESLRLFASICCSQWFTNSAMLVFFNKTDVFKQKIANVPLQVCFPNFSSKFNEHDE